jgi:hypothetical protein
MALRAAARQRAAGLTMTLLPLAVIAVLVAVGRQPHRFAANGIAFDVPAPWRIHDQIPASSGMGSTLALIGTMPWGPCDAYDINCHYQERLSRHEIQVDVSVQAMLGTDFCTYAHDRPDMDRTDGVRVTETHYIRVDGHPAISTVFSLDSPDYYLSDQWRTWVIAAFDSMGGTYRISAEWRGPGDDEFIEQLDGLIASIRFDASGQAGLPNCGAPFPAAVAGTGTP